MANTQIPKSSTPVVVTLVVNSTGAGTTAPASAAPSFNVWLGGTKVVADTALGTLPITVNGLTVSAYTNNSVPFATSITIAVAPSTSLAASTGYIVNVSSPANNPSSGVFDIPVAWGYTATGAITAAVNGNYIPVTGTGATLNSATQYTNGTYFLGYSGTAWLIDTTINNGAIPTCSSPTAGASVTNVPASGWSGSASCATAPTFTGITTTTGYTVSGAGTTAANGNYVPVTGANATFNSATQYTNGTQFLAFITTPGAPYWGISALVNQVYTGTILYANTTGASTTNLPLTGWAVGAGTAPAPTLTVISGGATAPTALTSVAVALADSGTAPNPTLTWVLPASGTAYTGFNVRRGTVAAGESATPVNGSALGAGVLSFVDTTAVYAGDYYYVVDGLWASGTVTTSELHIKSMTAAPTSLAATFGNSQAALTWVNATGALGIVVERTPQGANTWTTITTAATPITSFTDSTVVNGTAYSFRIRNLD